MERIVFEGQGALLVAAQAADGTYPIEEFLLDLQRRKKTDADKIFALLKFVAEKGPQRIRNVEKVKKVAGELWEFKAKQVRVFWAYGEARGDRRTCILLTGTVKKRPKLSQSDIERAGKLLEEQRKDQR